MDALRKYLVQLPGRLDFENYELVAQNVKRALYYAATGEGKYIPHIFSNVPEGHIERLKDYRWPLANTPRPFYSYTEPRGHFHPPGSICARQIDRHEKCYVCTDCAYDETCIMCSHCFNAQDHAGHNVASYASGGGGLCDCGDQTAFVRELHCKTHQQTGLAQDLPPELASLMATTVATVLAYVLDVANFSVNTLPLVHRNINGRGDLAVNSALLSDLCSLPTDAYGAEDVNSDAVWHLVLWNDENHNYPEAETSIRAAAGVGNHKAKLIANEINAHGRAILKTASCYEDLLPSQKAAEVDGLVATICTSRDYMRELIVLEMFRWLADIVSFENNALFRLEAKRIVGELLLQHGHNFSKTLPGEFLKSATIDIKHGCFTNGIPYYGELLTRGPARLKPDVDSRSISDPVDDFFYAEPAQTFARSPIQYLLAFEIRFVAELRKIFTSSILPVLFSDAGHKQRFCEQYSEIFPTLSAILAYSDREEKIVSMSTITLQLFTCPLTNQWILTSGNLPNFIYPLNLLIQDQAAKPNESGIPNLHDVVVDIRSRREKSSIHMTIQHMIEAIHHIISKNDEENLLNYILDEQTLYHVLLFQRFFQGICPVTRKYGDHVGTESLGALQSFLNKSAPILNIVKNCCKVKDLDKPKALHALKKMAAFLYTRQIQFQSSGVAEFRVSKDPVSLINPVNSFFSFVLQEIGMEQATPFLLSLPEPFLHISDFSLRSIVLASQIRIGAWIRNGLIVSQQLSCYTEESMEETSHHRDFHLNQIEALRDDPETVMKNFLDRWELLSWYQNDVEYDHTVYEHRFHFICERFIIFLYNLLTDRNFFDNSDMASKVVERCRMAICYSLCEKPKAYTELKNLVPSFASNCEQFDEILQECATYQPPTGVYDTGMYRLKPSYYEKLDPLSQLDCSESQSIFEELIAAIAKNRNVDAKSVILQPKIAATSSAFVNEKLGAVFRTKLFAKLVYKLLQIAIDTKDEAFLPHLLHLLHATIVDNEMVRDNSLQKSFVTIPICNLLLTISESSSSPTTASKADFLLDKFIAKDGAVMDSLVDCFGETHINQYRIRKDDLSSSKRQKSLKTASDRKAKIMKKFERQREKFMKKNHMTGSSEESNEEILRHCVSCGEVEDFEEPFGILVALSNAAFRKLPPDENVYTGVAFEEFSHILQPEGDAIYPEGFPKENTYSYRVGSTCAHGIHLKCHSMGQLQNLPCPLCHNMHDVVLINYRCATDKNSVDTELFYGVPTTTDHEKMEVSLNSERNEQILKQLVHRGYFSRSGSLKPRFLKNIAPKFDLPMSPIALSRSEKIVNTLNKLAHTLADSIRANEMAFRLDGSSTLADLISEIPTSLRVLVISLVQSRVLLFHSEKDALSEEELKPVWNSTIEPSSFFNEVVIAFFSGKESLQTTIRVCLAKLLASTAVTLCSNYKGFLNSARIGEKHAIAPESLESVTALCEKLSGPVSPLFAANFYVALERCLLPYLRQCAIFVDILFAAKVGENEFRSHPMFAGFEDMVESQANQYSTHALSKVLGIPGYDEIWAALRTKSSSVETKVIGDYTQASFYESLPLALREIDFPNAPRLITLPTDFSRTMIDPNFSGDVDSFCLACGDYVAAQERFTHMEACMSGTLFFSPDKTSIVAVVKINFDRYLLKLPGPYMTIHGEVKAGRSSGPATLSELRYYHLNKLWVNQSLFGFATRNIYGATLNPGMRPAAEESFEESDEDLGFWE